MKFNLTLLEFCVFLLVCLVIYGWCKHSRRLQRWLAAYKHQQQRVNLQQLKPHSPTDCPLCCQDICWLPQRPRLEVVAWSERKSPRGRPKVVDTAGYACLNPGCDYFAIADATIHALVSNGHRGKQGILYLKCQACCGCRTSRYATPLYWLKTPLVRITMVMTALSEGVDLSAASRIFSHHPRTLAYWLARSGQHSQRLQERLFQGTLTVGHLQLDELVTQVKQEAHRLWLWTAVAAESKLIVAFHLGHRTTADAHQLLHWVWQRLRPNTFPIFTSDGLNHYFYAITAHFGAWGKPEGTRQFRWLPDNQLLYAQLRKQRSGRKLRFLYSIRVVPH